MSSVGLIQWIWLISELRLLRTTKRICHLRRKKTFRMIEPLVHILCAFGLVCISGAGSDLSGSGVPTDPAGRQAEDPLNLKKTMGEKGLRENRVRFTLNNNLICLLVPVFRYQETNNLYKDTACCSCVSSLILFTILTSACPSGEKLKCYKYSILDLKGMASALRKIFRGILKGGIVFHVYIPL